ncbi:hypothetical protein H310_14266 [Aphanomyces invadans]|uniref:glucan endo-1,3-beta-D-glucosidase n=1 Tax=Aphanomyces invadans TaxID=157072 RepID=A0A024TBP8_9STRA|nr:hypothetical protein H310_14266 [Aphanomyces invadans]ETV91026.1 hypothetical protein H310_14266 [Aphanomyces invadans]|eukprot:XP_008880306.1 hypothetical protein H310_14266 [Aphanomyces invadans]
MDRSLLPGLLQFVLVVVLCVVSVAADEFGVCYDSYDAANMVTHFRTIRERFGSVRTFQTAVGGQNAITAAANTGLKIAAGVWLLGNRYQIDLDAAIAGTRANPNAVQVIFIGNEELHQGWSADTLASVVQDAKSKLAAAGVHVPIGIAQTDGDLLANPWLADQVDVVGANIHPFFSEGPDSKTDPFQDFKRRWQAIVSKFGDKARITEVGWPTKGGSFLGHPADPAMSEKLYNDVKEWQQSTRVDTYYFMFHDNLGKSGFEGHFGLARPSGEWKFGGGHINPPTDAPFTRPPTTSAPPAPTTSSPLHLPILHHLHLQRPPHWLLLPPLPLLRPQHPPQTSHGPLLHLHQPQQPRQ